MCSKLKFRSFAGAKSTAANCSGRDDLFYQGIPVCRLVDRILPSKKVLHEAPPKVKSSSAMRGAYCAKLGADAVRSGKVQVPITTKKYFEADPGLFFYFWLALLGCHCIFFCVCFRVYAVGSVHYAALKPGNSSCS